MKTSIILIILIFLNTSAIIAEPIAALLKGINTWILLLIEALLLLGYLFHVCIKDINKKCVLDTHKLRVFVTKNKDV